jgi:hypothetical protein
MTFSTRRLSSALAIGGAVTERDRSDTTGPQPPSLTPTAQYGPVGPRGGGGLARMLAVVLGLTWIALCRALPREDRRRGLIGAWLGPNWGVSSGGPQRRW